MAGIVIADTLQADSTSTLVLKNGVANTPPTVQDSAGTQIGTFCRAWVNFNGTLSTPITPRASFNVSSVTKAATGDYTITFTTAMSDANYAIAGAAQFGTAGGSQALVAVKTAAAPYAAGSINIVTLRTDTAALTDFTAVNVAVFR